MAEFSGERVIPGKVDVDLWNEHLSRYLFASRLCRFKKVIDLGCGSGYGSAELAKKAESVVGVDVSEEAIAEAKVEYTAANLQFQVASLEQLPFTDGSFQLGVCFEVIEHLTEYRTLLAEARRVLAPGGQLVISTPNIKFYAESRKLNGPNPFHEHEFSYEEFREVLGEFFEHQTFFVQNHASGLVFLPLDGAVGTELRLESGKPDPDEAHFFLAVCAAKPMTGAPSFVYVPTAANVLREREHHIQRLEGELTTKNEWLEASRAEHKTLVDQFRLLKLEMEAKNQWALEQNQRVEKAQQAIARMEGELAAQHEESAQVVAAYEKRLQEVEAEALKQAECAQANQAKLDSQISEIAAHSVKLDGDLKKAGEQLAEYQKKLDEAEALVIERTLWAQSEQKQREEAEGKVAAVEASRWIRMGKAFGLGPKIS
ncbi:MAG: methyltransferase domain-containing protein [Acidobacteria bacterium]|nr:methyltransferase domain-containing protein [Acidobacteriota bacterium]